MRLGEVSAGSGRGRADNEKEILAAYFGHTKWDVASASSGRYGNTLAFSYDGASRLATEALTVGGQTYSVTRTYDGDNRVSGLQYPDGSSVSRTYTPRGLLANTALSGATVASFTYDAGGRRETRVLGDTPGTTTTWTYTGRSDNLPVMASTPNVTTIGWSYDVNGNLTAEAFTGSLSPYGFTTGNQGYDNEDRLVAWSRSDGQQATFTLSQEGDWQQYALNGTQQTRVYSEVHNLSSVNGNLLTYDPKGNLTANTATGATGTWDFDNRLNCSNAAGATTTFSYDALGRRVLRQDATGVTVFVSCSREARPSVVGHELAEYTLGALPTAPLRKYVFGSRTDEVVMLASGGANYYYHASGNNSTVAMTDQTGAVAELYAYGAYGATTIFAPDGVTGRASSSVGNELCYTGRRCDATTGYYYYRARYYDPNNGQFLSRDPSGYRAGLNLYAYVADRPLSCVDPTGLDAEFFSPGDKGRKGDVNGGKSGGNGGGGKPVGPSPINWTPLGPPYWVDISSWTQTREVYDGSKYVWNGWQCIREDWYHLESQTVTSQEERQDFYRKNPELAALQQQAAALVAAINQAKNQAAYWQGVGNALFVAAGIAAGVALEICTTTGWSTPVVGWIACGVASAVALSIAAGSAAAYLASMAYTQEANDLEAELATIEAEISDPTANWPDETMTEVIGARWVKGPWIKGRRWIMPFPAPWWKCCLQSGGD